MTVTYEVRDRVAIITIDRPGRRNAVDRATARALGRAWDRFQDDDGADVGILYGEGGHFSAGADLKAFDLVDDDDGHLGFTRRQVDKPTIAAIEGYCVAGGLEMAIWCDLRVAASDAVFGCFERRFGVPLVDGGTQRLPRLVGHGLAMELILTGRPVQADEAHAIGLVNVVTAPDSVLATAIEWGKRIAHHPQETLRSDRKALLDGSTRPLEEGLEIERRLGSEVMHVARAGADHFATGEGRSGAAVRALMAVPETDDDDVAWNRVAPTRSRPGTEVEDISDVEPLAGTGPDAVDEAETEILDLEGDAAAAPATHWEGREGSAVDLGLGRTGYFIAPVIERGRAVILLSDLGQGLDEFELIAAERLADLGHSTLAIDVFGEHEDPDSIDPETASRLVATSIDTVIAGGFAASGTVGLVGFGVGGALAMWIAGSEERVTSVVAFSPHSPWPEVTRTRLLSGAAYLCHQGDGEQPPGAPSPALAEMELRDQGVDATFHVYPSTGLHFFDEQDPDFHERMTDIAWQRTSLFLDRHL